MYAINGSGTQTSSVTTSATGKITDSGTAAQTSTLTTGASGKITDSGTGVQTSTVSTSAAGARGGSGTQTSTFSSTATGKITDSGTAAQSSSITTTATGSWAIPSYAGTSLHLTTATSAAIGSVTDSGTAAQVSSYSSSARGTIWLYASGGHTTGFDGGRLYDRGFDWTYLTTGASAVGFTGIPAWGSQTSTISTTASGFIARAGTAAQTSTLSSSATGTVVDQGTATQASTVTTGATGAVRLAGTGGQTSTLTAAASGSVRIAGTAAQTTSFSSTAAGTVSYPATAAQTSTVTTAAAGTLTFKATGSQTSTVTGTATGITGFPGTGVQTSTVTTAATGAIRSLGTGSQTTTITTGAIGLVRLLGTGTHSTAVTTAALAGSNTNATGAQVSTVTTAAVATLIEVPGMGLSQVAFLSSADGRVRLSPELAAIPGGRGLWRLTLHARQFSDLSWDQTVIGELTDATRRELKQEWSSSATLTFTMDGRDPAVKEMQELACDVVAWRWDTQSGSDKPMFRGIVTQSEDDLDANSHTVSFTCHDYYELFSRRILTSTLAVTQMDQDDIVRQLLARATGPRSSDGTANFTPAAYLPLAIKTVNPDGTVRGASHSAGAPLRDRNYYGNQNIGSAIDQLSKVINGFDVAVKPVWGATRDELRLYYPSQGIERDLPVLEYGGSVTTVKRQVSSADYSNYWRTLGNNQQSDPGQPQLYGEAWTKDAQTVAPGAVGLWMTDENRADVILKPTLEDAADGGIAAYSVLVPSYTLSLTPEVYQYDLFDLGDALPLVIMSGRLQVDTSVRVMGVTFHIGDDGQEDIELIVGRPLTSLASLMTAWERDVNALSRR